MSGLMFGFLGKLFRFLRKREPEQQPVGMSNPVVLKEPVPEPQPVAKPEEQHMAPHSSSEPNRPEKTCPKCGSPNDKFVHVCWMCKAEI